MGEAFVTPEWLTAIGTVATAVVAVAVAIGLQWWTSYREKSKAPRLTLERDESWFANEMGWPRLSLAVRNAPGKQAANDVQVSVEVITEGRRCDVLRPPNMTLPWSNLFDREIMLRPMKIPAGGQPVCRSRIVRGRQPPGKGRSTRVPSSGSNQRPWRSLRRDREFGGQS